MRWVGGCHCRGGRGWSPCPGHPTMLLTTLATQALLARPAALLPLRGHAQLPCHLVLHPRKAEQEPLLVDGFLQGFDGRLQLFLHSLSQAVQVAAGWGCGGGMGVQGGKRDAVRKEGWRGKASRIKTTSHMLGCKSCQTHPNLVRGEDWFGSPCCMGMAPSPWSHRRPSPWSHHPCLHLRRAKPVLCPPVISSGLISASNSSVMRVTSLLEELRARRPFPFLDESHLRLTKATWQSEQGAEPPAPGGTCSQHPIPPGGTGIPAATTLPSDLTLRPSLPGLILLALGPRVQVAFSILDLEGSLLLDWCSDSL